MNWVMRVLVLIEMRGYLQRQMRENIRSREDRLAMDGLP